jgi:hypothetical protein
MGDMKVLEEADLLVPLVPTDPIVLLTEVVPLEEEVAFAGLEAEGEVRTEAMAVEPQHTIKDPLKAT